MSLLKSIADSYMHKVSGLKEHCDRCLRTERWGGSVVLMVVDAAFTYRLKLFYGSCSKG